MKKYDLKRMNEVMIPIDNAIMMCDSQEEILMLASTMLSTAKTMFVSVLGEEGAAHVIRGVLPEHQ